MCVPSAHTQLFRIHQVVALCFAATAAAVVDVVVLSKCHLTDNRLLHIFVYEMHSVQSLVKTHKIH